MDAWTRLVSGATISGGDAWELLKAQGGDIIQGGGPTYRASSFSILPEDVDFDLTPCRLGFTLENHHVIFTTTPTPWNEETAVWDEETESWVETYLAPQ